MSRRDAEKLMKDIKLLFETNTLEISSKYKYVSKLKIVFLSLCFVITCKTFLLFPLILLSIEPNECVLLLLLSRIMKIIFFLFRSSLFQIYLFDKFDCIKKKRQNFFRMFYLTTIRRTNSEYYRQRSAKNR